MMGHNVDKPKANNGRRNSKNPVNYEKAKSNDGIMETAHEDT